MQKQLDFVNIGKRIKKVRLEKKLTQDNVAEFVGINTSHISNIESGKAKVSLTSLVLICSALGVTIDYILENEYACPTSSIEKEIMNALRTMDKERKEQLLRIAKVL